MCRDEVSGNVCNYERFFTDLVVKYPADSQYSIWCEESMRWNKLRSSFAVNMFTLYCKRMRRRLAESVRLNESFEESREDIG